MLVNYPEILHNVPIQYIASFLGMKPESLSRIRRQMIVSVPKNVPHYFLNPGHVEAHYLQEFFPALKIDGLFETFFAMARDGKLNKKGAPNIFQTSLIMLAHEKEFRLTKPNWYVQKLIFKLMAPVGRMLGYKEAHQYAKKRIK